MSSLDEKTREIIDAAERGEIVIGSGAVETIAIDDGKITHTTRRICTPCANGKHGECDFMCDCNHPSHDRSSSEP